MNPADPTKPSESAPSNNQQSASPLHSYYDPNNQNANNPLETMREGEIVICNIKRHPIGILGVYLTFALLVVIVAALGVAAPTLFPNTDSDQLHLIAVGALLFAVLFAGIFAFIARTVYYGNRWIVTSDSITQIERHSLFDTQSSQLSLANLEDITVHQDGIIANIFSYGTLNAETAGERSKFVFPFCPNPTDEAKKILLARENFEQGQWYAEQRPDHRPSMPSDQPPA